jgi:signal transduction histidine kinase
MLKLEHKLIIYSALTKLVILLFSGVLVFLFLNDITFSQLDSRLVDKANNFIKNVSKEEINLALDNKNSFTNYNILKEEFITVKELSSNYKNLDNKVFLTENKLIDADYLSYRALKQPFAFNSKVYELEIGLSLINVNRIKRTIIFVTLLVVFISLVLGLILDFINNKLIFASFYKIVDKKIAKVDNPFTYNYKLIGTSTKDFRALDLSIGSLMTKISNIILKEKQFIANVSHELLTPISILTVRLENLLNIAPLTVEQEEKIYTSIDTLRRLKGVVNSLLLISKVENFQFDKPDEIIIKKSINEILIDLEDRIESQNITLENLLQFDFQISGNIYLMHVFFSNIINNAIKYSDTRGRVIIKDKKSKEFYTIYIIDNGIGMEADKIEYAFNRFEKLGNEEKEDSHGLGLAIVKSIGEFHEIDIEIKSEIGKGSTFILRFKIEELGKHKNHLN